MKTLLYFILLIAFCFPNKATFAQTEQNVWITTAHQEYQYNAVSEETTPHLYGTLHDPLNQADSWFEASVSINTMNGDFLYTRAGIRLGGDTLNIVWNLGGGVVPGEAYTLVFNLVKWTSDLNAPPLWSTTDTAIVTISYPIVTGIEDNPEVSNLLAYPNPTASDITVTGLGDVDKQIFVYEITGQQVLSVPVSGQETQRLNFSRLPTGMYIIAVRSATDAVRHLRISKTGLRNAFNL